MKKKLFFVFIGLVFMISSCLCACGAKDYYYDSDEIYFNYSELSDFSKKDIQKYEDTVPQKSEIIGVYYVTGTDNETNETLGWKIYVTEKNGKLVMQAFENGVEYSEISDDELTRMKSDFNTINGEFSQTYEDEQYTSTLNAKFRKDLNGRIKITVSRRSQLKNDYQLVNSINASGFKEVG